MELGLLLPSGQAQLQAGSSARSIVDVAVAAERHGFDSVWVGDSLSRPRLEPLTVLAAIATATERVRLGTAVLMPAYRHPVHAAASIASLDLLSEGRLIVGVGAGFPGFSERELEMVGVPFRTRFTRLDETVQLWRELWNGQPTSFHGKELHYDWLPEVPAPAQAGGPPIWLGGITPRALARTARLYDGWLPYPPDVADYAGGLATITAAADGRPITPALFATVVIDDDAERADATVDEYCRATYGMGRDLVGQIQAIFAGDAATVIDGIAAYAAAGASHVLLRIGAIDTADFATQFERVVAVLDPLRSQAELRR